MAPTPAFITQYEVLRSKDYVLITLSAPTGGLDGDRLQTEVVQRIALTVPRFLEFVATLSQMAGHMKGVPDARPAPRPGFREERSRAPDNDERRPEDDGALKGPGDRVVRH